MHCHHPKQKLCGFSFVSCPAVNTGCSRTENKGQSTGKKPRVLASIEKTASMPFPLSMPGRKNFQCPAQWIVLCSLAAKQRNREHTKTLQTQSIHMQTLFYQAHIAKIAWPHNGSKCRLQSISSRSAGQTRNCSEPVTTPVFPGNGTTVAVTGSLLPSVGAFASSMPSLSSSFAGHHHHKQ